MTSKQYRQLRYRTNFIEFDLGVEVCDLQHQFCLMHQRPNCQQIVEDCTIGRADMFKVYEQYP